MSLYGTKYKLKFKDELKRVWTLLLKQLDYAGSIYSVMGSDEPITFSDPNQNNGKLNNIKGLEMEMELVISRDILNFFYNDFAYATDREWQAHFSRSFEGEELQEAICELNSLNLDNVSSDPYTDVEIIGTGGLVTQPQCKLEFALNVSESGTIEFIAVPESAGLYYPNKISLGTANIAVDDFSQTVNNIDAIAGMSVLYSDQTSGQIEVEYTVTTYYANLDTEWVIKLDTSASYELISQPYFDSACVRSWYEINLVIADKNGDTPEVVTLGRRYFQNGETTEDIASELQTKCDGYGFSFYFYICDEVRSTYIMTELKGIDNHIIGFKLVSAGGCGNIPVKNKRDIYGPRPNETYLEINHFPNTRYDANISDFTGGSDGGDTFTFEVDNGFSISVKGYGDDSRSDIVSRLVGQINGISANFNAFVDDTTDTIFHVTTEIEGLSYRFTTSGSSGTNPMTYTNFSLGNDEQIKWIGWVIPGMFTDPLEQGYAKVNLSAIDGLGDLKAYDLTVNNLRPYGKLSILDILLACLDKTGLNFRIYEAFDLWEVNMNVNDSPLLQTYEDASRLNGVNCYDILERVAFLTKSRIMQRNGHWELVPKDKEHTSFSYRVFSVSGMLLDTIESPINIREVGESKINKFIGRSQTNEYADVYKYVEFKQGFGFVDQMLKFPSFNGVNDNLGGAEGDVHNPFYPWQMRFDDSIQTGWLSKVYKKGDYLVIIDDHQQDNTQYISQKFVIGDIALGDPSEKQYEFSIRWEIKGVDIVIMLKITDGTNTVYLKEVDSDESPFTETHNTITFPAESGYGDASFSAKFDYPSDIMNSDQAEAEIRIYQPSVRRIKIREAKVKVNTIAPSGQRDRSYYDELVDELSYEPLKKDIKIGDVPQTVIAKQVYKNALFWKDSEDKYQLTEMWSDGSSDGEEKPILEHIRHLYLREYCKSQDSVATERRGPPTILMADIRGDIELRDIIKDTVHGGLFLTLIGGEWRVRSCVVSGEWEQVNIDDSGLTRIDEQKSYEKDSSGSNSYTTIAGGDEDTEVDLSDYLTESEIISLVGGTTKSFTGADLTNRQITVYHNLNREPVLVTLIQDGKRVNPANYEWDSKGSNNYIVITLNYPLGDSQTIKIRML